VPHLRAQEKHRAQVSQHSRAHGSRQAAATPAIRPTVWVVNGRHVGLCKDCGTPIYFPLKNSLGR